MSGAVSGEPTGYDVCGVGRAVYDHCVLVDRHPEADTKTVALDRWRGSGSPVPNALCQLARWGRSVGLQAAVGGDVEGERIREQLQASGVDVRSLQVRSTDRTPTAYIWVERGSGRRTIVLDRNLASLSSDELSCDPIRGSRALLLDGWETDAALEGANIAHETGVQVVLDAGGVRDRMDRMLGVTDWLIVPAAFVRDYYEEPVDLFHAVRDLLARGRGDGARGVVITNGPAGSVGAERGRPPQWFQAYPVDAVDTTGAGDVFHAGFIHGLLAGWRFEMCVRWASAAAALSVTALGSRGKLPSRGEVRELLARHHGGDEIREIDT